MEKSNKKKYMKVSNTYIIIAAAALLTLIGCTKKQIDQTPGVEIMLTATESGSTKALLDNGAFAAIGNRLKIYDYFTPGASGSPDYYIDDFVVSGGGYTWPFANGRYEWTSDGVHKFWGWLDTDVNFDPDMTASSFFSKGFSFDPTNQVLTIGVTSMTQSSTQFDFMYSSVYNRKLNPNPDYSAIPLEFHHLFTAFSIAAKDVAEFNEYLIESIQVKGMKTTCSATVDFSGDETVVTYNGSANTDAAFTFAPSSSFKLTTELTDVATWTETREHFLAWPQDARTVSIVIIYKAKEVNDAAYTSYTKTILLPFALEAGKKNNINLEFKDKEITLDYYIEDWITVTEEIDFSDQVTVDEETGTIKWVDGVQEVDYVNGEVILFDDPKIEATCTFTILTPKGATWTASLISKEGHPDAFRFVEGTKYGTVGDESTIKLVVTNQDPISPRHVAELLITVQTADGRTIVVDDALTPEEYEGQPTTYTRFKIIQNLIN